MPLDTYMAAPSSPAPYTYQLDPNAMVQQSLEEMLNPNSSYIQNARRRGVEYAASRGGLNSSIAAGASERAAVEAAQPLVAQAMDIQKQRDAIAGQDWLNTQNFNREFQGQIAMLPVTNAYNMMQMVQQFAMMDPALYTPDVISGYTDFFSKSMNDLMSQYFSSTSTGEAP